MHLAVGAREDQSLLAIVEANQEGRLTIRAPHLHHVTHAVGTAHNAAVHAQPITDTRSRGSICSDTSSSSGRCP